MDVAGISGEQLRQFIEKVEKLEEDKTELMEVIREVFAEAKGEGFDIRVIRQIFKVKAYEERRPCGARGTSGFV